MTDDFFIERRIYYHNTDAGGIVYYANYLLLCEEGRAEFLREHGIDTGEYAKKGVIFPVIHLEADYKAPARYGDTIKIFTRVERIGNSSMHFSQEIKKGGASLVTVKTVWACTRSDGVNFKTMPVPDAIRKALTSPA